MKKAAVLALIALAVACNSGGKINIKGEVEGTEKVFIARIGPEEIEYLDTVDVKDGKFSYQTEFAGPEFIMLEMDNKYRYSLLVENGDNIKFSADLNDPLGAYELSGSEGSERILKINGIVRGLFAVIDSLTEVNETAMSEENYGEIRQKLDNRYVQAEESTRQSLLAMLREDPAHLSNLFIFPMGVGNAQLIPADRFMDDYEMVLDTMLKVHPNNEHVTTFADRMQQMASELQMQEKLNEAMARASKGNAIPDFTLPDVDGNLRKISDLKGKVVLVDFWAAWCQPCRAESPRLVEMYKKYKAKGFEIFSVSLDGLPNQPDARAAWTQAISEDKLNWPNNVSDLMGWNSSVIEVFGFQSIPYTLLIDREGIIIEQGLRGEALEAAIQKAL